MKPGPSAPRQAIPQPLRTGSFPKPEVAQSGLQALVRQLARLAARDALELKPGPEAPGLHALP